NSAVAADAEAAGVWCVRADDAAASAAWVPAVGGVDDVQVAVTAGGDPRRAARLRVAVTAPLREGRLPLRRTRRPAGEPGRVALVGGGPGDPDLITVRGRRLLAGADVVVVDRLAPRELLAELDPDVEVVDAGKAAGSHRLRQEQINAVLVERARRGARVVRLKGGDPFLFGRGGEEALACARAGVPYEVVPGVTSAIGVPAAAGIPVTHRGTAQQLVITTGHLEPGHPDSGLDWARVAGAHGTLVLLMAVERLEQVVAALIRHGRPADTPVAVIQRGTTAAERTVTGDLGSIGGRVAAAGLGPPAVVVVGDVVRLRTALAPG
ncbi:MAG TPA: uroporphyrinogen-III C-methyltransferase, partial [Frankiaceae bacterium]|nr:uroporphyrinogen-III C-methyltransferase [Frankiaceae bacterium]